MSLFINMCSPNYSLFCKIKSKYYHGQVEFNRFALSDELRTSIYVRVRKEQQQIFRQQIQSTRQNHSEGRRSPASTDCVEGESGNYGINAIKQSTL